MWLPFSLNPNLMINQFYLLRSAIVTVRPFLEYFLKTGTNITAGS